LIGPYPSCDSKPGSKSKIRSACRYSHYRWGVLVARTIPRATAARRPARIVKLIRHAKSTDAAHGCPALLKGEEAAIRATAKPTARILCAPSSIIAGQAIFTASLLPVSFIVVWILCRGDAGPYKRRACQHYQCKLLHVGLLNFIVDNT